MVREGRRGRRGLGREIRVPSPVAHGIRVGEGGRGRTMVMQSMLPLGSLRSGHANNYFFKKLWPCNRCYHWNLRSTIRTNHLLKMNLIRKREVLCVRHYSYDLRTMVHIKPFVHVTKAKLPVGFIVGRTSDKEVSYAKRFRKKKDQTQFLNIENLQIILAWNPILEPGSTTKRFKMNKIKQYLHIEALN